MIGETRKNPQDYVSRISSSGLTIYDPVEIGDPNLWIPSSELETLLHESLVNTSLEGLPLRTRSKVVKQLVCQSLGYPIPKGFKKTQPRFPGQNFDIYIQKSNNLQIWNEEVSPERRYVIIRVSPEDMILKIKVVNGDSLSFLDTTGTLTQKYQARLVLGNEQKELIVDKDTTNLLPVISDSSLTSFFHSPLENPFSNHLLPIRTIFERVGKLVGRTFPDAGSDQERNRGAALHQMVCQTLGYANYQDDGRFPDIRNQLLEVKLQTSPTIDLGLVVPNSKAPLGIPKIGNTQVRHCDVRYVIFYAQTNGITVELTHCFVTTGEAFFSRFQQFQGNVINKKIQIPLPNDFFD